DSSMGFDADTCSVMNTVHGQSPDIAQGVGDNNDENSGAGDQGLIFGFACSETDNLMPLPIYLAHKLSERLTFVRKSGLLTYLRPDGKTQVTVEYDENDVPKRIDAIVVSTQHSEDVTLEQIKEDIIKHVITPIIDEKMMDADTKIYINPTGRFVIGGPFGDSGLTGRKIIVDTYGGYARHGGGAFSGKDPSKVDRSAAYMARYIAKNLVAASLCEKCEIQLAYAIGVAKPVSVRVDTFGTGKLSEDKLEELVIENFDLRPYGIIKTLGLRNPIYKKTSNYGHMGKEGLPWEETNMAETLKKAANI
ncbi:MAG: methionine adenosyltransferase, partial [Clostridia bacterium]|nr:methionine adenosyltransferase [Clostridia bacterium]